jgi:hypothetical protein
MKKSSLQIAVAQIPIEQDDDVLMEGRKEVWSSSPGNQDGGNKKRTTCSRSRNPFFSE